MLKQWPFKKDYFLVLLILLLLALSYQLAFKRTLQLLNDKRELESNLSKRGNLTFPAGYLERKDRNTKAVIDLYRADTVSFRSNVLSIVSLAAEKQNVRLTEVPAMQAYFQTDKIIVQKLEFEGDFFALLRFYHQLPSLKEVGQVRSVKFYTVQSAGSSKPSGKLAMAVYMAIAK